MGQYMNEVIKEQTVKSVALPTQHGHSRLLLCTWQCNRDATVAMPSLTRQLIEPLASRVFHLLPLDHRQTHAKAVDWTAVQF